MNTITKKMSKQEIFALKERVANQIQKESRPQYTFYQIKLRECTITAYTSGKVVFQGKDLDWLAPDTPQQADVYPQAGSDEVGTGDYFGPVVVSATIVEKDRVDVLRSMGIQDSKQINDEKIRQLAPRIKELCPYTILVVSNDKYNQVHQTHNMVDIKCLLHNQAYVNLQQKGYTLPNFLIIDQFVQKSSYYRYLQNQPKVIPDIHFETTAENKYLSVACGSILARNAFLEAWDAMEAKYHFHFEKGAGKQVDLCAQRFVDEFGKSELGHVAKLHFANTKKLK